ncbi:ABC transporter ATP-binding protein [Virgibacillus dokdonensis]|uniref:Energy-coupling factor transporter ATP-binding protein EcfA1 n=1 Tax=Virgibacillus dokdonensis TaxID=302167 RepID=A0A2K9IWP0_9BACI|nr:ABC transporter ATP-binding protein [Virgibacillus dokdonensis]AUJ23834.1 Energy-coupling factor transporter ATP-binding protein EcfA1 [Virgibacillus dokdonensis]
MLKLDEVYKRYDDINVLEGISFQADKGEVLSIVGHNGAGKTTLLKIITGIILQNTGKIELNGKLRKKSHLKNISMMLEGNKNFYLELTLYENIEYFYRIKGYKYTNLIKNKIDRYLIIFNLVDHAKKPIYKLSRGMQQKVAVILNFVLPSELILLDEPTLGLDIFSVDEFQALIANAKNDGKTILITSHQLDLLQRLSDRLIILHKGKIVFNNNSEVFLNKYAPSQYRILYNEDIPTKEIEKLDYIQYSYNFGSSNKELIVDENISLIDYLNVLDLTLIKSIEKNIPSLETAYKKFWNEV